MKFLLYRAIRISSAQQISNFKFLRSASKLLFYFTSVLLQISNFKLPPPNYLLPPSIHCNLFCHTLSSASIISTTTTNHTEKNQCMSSTPSCYPDPGRKCVNLILGSIDHGTTAHPRGPDSQKGVDFHGFPRSTGFPRNAEQWKKRRKGAGGDGRRHTR